MKNYEILLSAEINSINELKKNYLINIDTLEKICACSVAINISNDAPGAGDNILNLGLTDDIGVLALDTGDINKTIIAYDSTYTNISNRIPTREMLTSIRTISKYI